MYSSGGSRLGRGGSFDARDGFRGMGSLYFLYHSLAHGVTAHKAMTKCPGRVEYFMEWPHHGKPRSPPSPPPSLILPSFHTTKVVL